MAEFTCSKCHGAIEWPGVQHTCPTPPRVDPRDDPAWWEAVNLTAQELAERSPEKSEAVQHHAAGVRDAMLWLLGGSMPLPVPDDLRPDRG